MLPGTCFEVPSTVDNDPVAHRDRAVANARQREVGGVGDLTPEPSARKIHRPKIVKHALIHSTETRPNERDRSEGKREK